MSTRLLITYDYEHYGLALTKIIKAANLEMSDVVFASRKVAY